MTVFADTFALIAWLNPLRKPSHCHIVDEVTGGGSDAAAESPLLDESKPGVERNGAGIRRADE